MCIHSKTYSWKESTCLISFPGFMYEDCNYYYQANCNCNTYCYRNRWAMMIFMIMLSNIPVKDFAAIYIRHCFTLLEKQKEYYSMSQVNGHIGVEGFLYTLGKQLLWRLMGFKRQNDNNKRNFLCSINILSFSVDR